MANIYSLKKAFKSKNLKGPSMDFFKNWFFKSPHAWVNCQEANFACKIKLRLGVFFVQLCFQNNINMAEAKINSEAEGKFSWNHCEPLMGCRNKTRCGDVSIIKMAKLISLLACEKVKSVNIYIIVTNIITLSRI